MLKTLILKNLKRSDINHIRIFRFATRFLTAKKLVRILFSAYLNKDLL